MVAARSRTWTSLMPSTCGPPCRSCGRSSPAGRGSRSLAVIPRPRPGGRPSRGRPIRCSRWAGSSPRRQVGQQDAEPAVRLLCGGHPVACRIGGSARVPAGWVRAHRRLLDVDFGNGLGAMLRRSGERQEVVLTMLGSAVTGTGSTGRTGTSRRSARSSTLPGGWPAGGAWAAGPCATSLRPSACAPRRCTVLRQQARPLRRDVRRRQRRVADRGTRARRSSRPALTLVAAEVLARRRTALRLLRGGPGPLRAAVPPHAPRLRALARSSTRWPASCWTGGRQC